MFSNIKLFLYNNNIVLKKKIEYQKEQEKNAEADLFRRPWCLYDINVQIVYMIKMYKSVIW